eukprot:737444-Pleurochrysis_carterae.AAC.1
MPRFPRRDPHPPLPPTLSRRAAAPPTPRSCQAGRPLLVPPLLCPPRLAREPPRRARPPRARSAPPR